MSMFKKILAAILFSVSFHLGAQSGINRPYPDFGNEHDSPAEEVTDVFLKVKQMQSQKLINFEYASHGSPWELEIRDLKGSLMLKRTTIRVPELSINSTDFSAGTYLCTLYTSNSIITKKLVVE